MFRISFEHSYRAESGPQTKRIRKNMKQTHASNLFLERGRKEEEMERRKKDNFTLNIYLNLPLFKF